MDEWDSLPSPIRMEDVRTPSVREIDEWVAEIALETHGLREEYLETGNMFYALKAIAIYANPKYARAQGEYAAFCMPAWCLDYLHSACGKAVAIADEVLFPGMRSDGELQEGRHLTPRAATRRISRALGLSEKGKSAVRNYASRAQNRRLARFHSDLTKRAGASPREALDEIRRLTSQNQDSSAYRILKQGRKSAIKDDRTGELVPGPWDLPSARLSEPESAPRQVKLRRARR